MEIGPLGQLSRTTVDVHGMKCSTLEHFNVILAIAKEQIYFMIRVLGSIKVKCLFTDN